ncbi:nucleoside-diphosphate kinase [candidate division KSB1 bacterium]|nr:nucleoside-diphosphate kinase [candidate division KSB1 bacterium]
MEQTLAILKPDAVATKVMGKVLRKIEEAGFTITALKMIRMTRQLAGAFYEVHKDKSFYNQLLDFMTEGPCVIAVLTKENAVEAWRALMGATDPEKAAAGTIRKELAENVSRNIVHGSDSPENARREVAFFFSDSELIECKMN